MQKTLKITIKYLNDICALITLLHIFKMKNQFHIRIHIYKLKKIETSSEPTEALRANL